MATPKKKPKVSAPVPATDHTPTDLPALPSRKRQWRLAFGLIFLLCGLFVCLALVSYFFTWKQDSDLFYSPLSFRQFLGQSGAPVANWGGRLGALLGHVLVARGAGLASLAIGIWLISVGARIVYGGRMAVLMRYLRWTAILLLLLAPILAYTMPHAAFAWGGAWGTQANEYLTGLLGKMGTGMTLLGVALFVIVSVFALDVMPILRRMRNRARKMRKSLGAAVADTFKSRDDDSGNEPATGLQPAPAPVSGHAVAARPASGSGALEEEDGEAAAGREDSPFTEDEDAGMDMDEEDDNVSVLSAKKTGAGFPSR